MYVYVASTADQAELSMFARVYIFTTNDTSVTKDVSKWNE